MKRAVQPETITVTMKGEGNAKGISQFLRWMAADIDELREAGKLHFPVDYTFDPDSDYVAATRTEKIWPLN